MKQMMMSQITAFEIFLKENERAQATIAKYMRDVRFFYVWQGEKALNKTVILEYKAYLSKRYATTSVNSILSSLNGFFAFCGWQDLQTKTIKTQNHMFATYENFLTLGEYYRLLEEARNLRHPRLFLLLQTICATGIRVSEVPCITIEAVRRGRAEVHNKGKVRYAFLPEDLCTALEAYAVGEDIKKGPIFITKNGKPIDRSNIWASMKRLCAKAGVDEKKVYPHNLRHLFARTYYAAQKDIVRLADILGHSSVATTRIYTMETGEIHQAQIQHLGLVSKIQHN